MSNLAVTKQGLFLLLNFILLKLNVKELDISCGPHCYRIEDFKSYSRYKSMRAIMTSLHPMGLIVRIYVGDH